MTNDNDIVKGDVPPYMNDTLRLFYAELQEGETDYQGMLSRLAAIIDAKAREDQFRMDTDERVQSIKETKIETIKQIDAILKKMEKEPPSSEYPEDIYTIGYITALSRAELEIEKLIKEVD